MRRTAAVTLFKGPVSSATGVADSGDSFTGTELSASSPTAKVVCKDGAGGFVVVTAAAPAPAIACSPVSEDFPPARFSGESAKISTLTSRSVRNFSVSSRCTLSSLAKGNAVFAATKLWEWIEPFFAEATKLANQPPIPAGLGAKLPASSDGFSGIWQSAQFCPFAG